MKEEVAVAKNKTWVEISNSEERIDELVKTNIRTIILTLESERVDQLKNMHSSERGIYLDTYRKSCE